MPVDLGNLYAPEAIGVGRMGALAAVLLVSSLGRNFEHFEKVAVIPERQIFAADRAWFGGV